MTKDKSKAKEEKSLKTDKASKESEELFSALIQHLTDLIWVVDKDTKIKYETPSIFRILGYKPGFLIGKTGISFVHPDDVPGALEAFREVLQKENSFLPTEFRFKHADGHWVKLEAVGSNMLDHPAIKGIVLTARDITDRKRSEELLRESEERFRTLTESTSDWIWETDHEGCYTYASPKIKELLGYEPHEVIGKTPFDFMPPEEAERVAKIFYDAKLSKEPFMALENINLHKDGRRVILETSGVPVFDSQGNLKGYRGIDRDITERKRVEDLLRKNEKELKKRVKELEEFYNMAIGRELRMMQLKKENEKLQKEIESCRSRKITSSHK